ncbi:6399_t:CDS:2 [Funneliformis mosseae]|uniref:6399_t:CDS:1 n=1 Tax=Funneliformis mosseae TaxID=27381 RepID=A0A9N9CXP3_FUNMO|nr:6399_t:CDS:2 [Funneliformis mosseae]
MSFTGFSKRSQSTVSNQIRQNRKMKSPKINISEYQNERDDRDLDKKRNNDDYIETEYDESDHLSSDLETSRKRKHDMDDIVLTQTNKKIVKGIVTITKDIQKITLYLIVELFKGYLESYIEKHSKEYIKDIGKHRWDSHFYSEFMTIVFSEVFEIKANAVDDTGLPTINTIIMKAISREDKEVYNDLKNDDRSNDYNSTIKEEISEENHYESEDAMLFE